MNTLLISYDLVGTNETSADYERLIESIKAYGTYANVHRSVWVIRTNQTLKQVRDDLQRHMDANDRLFVIKTRRDAAWSKVLCTDGWLQDNLQDNQAASDARLSLLLGAAHVR